MFYRKNDANRPAVVRRAPAAAFVSARILVLSSFNQTY